MTVGSFVPQDDIRFRCGMSHTVSEYLTIPQPRRAAIEQLAREVIPGPRVRATEQRDRESIPARRVALSTHMNADGDGCGSEVALALMLAQRGLDVRIVNPTSWPDLFDFLLEGVSDRSAGGSAAFRDIDLLIVLDISDVKRLGSLAESVRRLAVPKMVIDHHIASDDPAGSIVLTDVAACATGELVYALARVLDFEHTPPIYRQLCAS